MSSDQSRESNKDPIVELQIKDGRVKAFRFPQPSPTGPITIIDVRNGANLARYIDHGSWAEVNIAPIEKFARPIETPYQKLLGAKASEGIRMLQAEDIFNIRTTPYVPPEQTLCYKEN